MIRIPNIVLNITTGLFAGVGAYTGNYWYLCGSAVCIAIYYYYKWEVLMWHGTPATADL